MTVRRMEACSIAESFADLMFLEAGLQIPSGDVVDDDDDDDNHGYDGTVKQRRQHQRRKRRRRLDPRKSTLDLPQFSRVIGMDPLVELFFNLGRKGFSRGENSQPQKPSSSSSSSSSFTTPSVCISASSFCNPNFPVLDKEQQQQQQTTEKRRKKKGGGGGMDAVDGHSAFSASSSFGQDGLSVREQQERLLAAGVPLHEHTCCCSFTAAVSLPLGSEHHHRHHHCPGCIFPILLDGSGGGSADSAADLLGKEEFPNLRVTTAKLRQKLRRLRE